MDHAGHIGVVHIGCAGGHHMMVVVVCGEIGLERERHPELAVNDTEQRLKHPQREQCDKREHSVIAAPAATPCTPPMPDPPPYVAHCRTVSHVATRVASYSFNVVPELDRFVKGARVYLTPRPSPARRWEAPQRRGEVGTRTLSNKLYEFRCIFRSIASLTATRRLLSIVSGII
jgi:hypothetical protein